MTFCTSFMLWERFAVFSSTSNCSSSSCMPAGGGGAIVRQDYVDERAKIMCLGQESGRGVS